MDLYGIRRKFDELCRSNGITEMTPLRDSWIDQGWEKITQNFEIPSLKKTALVDSVADEQTVDFPYDWDGTEVGIIYKKRRLDPVPEGTLRLKYERRSSNKGVVRFYDWSTSHEEPLLLVENVGLTNGSKTVLTTSTDTRLDEDYWLRGRPYEDSENDDKDNNEMVDPQDYGYQIDAGSFVSGVSFELTYPYRGPSGSDFTIEVRPSGQQRFIVYGTPSSAESDAFEIKYYAKPRRLYDNYQVPEWSSMGNAIATMAVSVYMEWNHNVQLSATYWGRAMSMVQGLEKRRNKSQELVSDLTMGSVVGRQTGPIGVFRGSGSRGRRG